MYIYIIYVCIYIRSESQIRHKIKANSVIKIKKTGRYHVRRNEKTVDVSVECDDGGVTAVATTTRSATNEQQQVATDESSSLNWQVALVAQRHSQVCIFLLLTVHLSRVAEPTSRSRYSD